MTNNEKYIQKTHWFYKSSLEESLKIQNIEAELNIFEDLKFEMTAIYYESELYVFIYNI